MSASSSTSPLTLPKPFVHSQHQTAPPTPSPSPSPPVPLYVRLSNGNHSVPSPTSSLHGVSFLLQIGLTREMVTLEPHDLSLSSVKDLVCSIVDQKVTSLQIYIFFLLFAWSAHFHLNLGPWSHMYLSNLYTSLIFRAHDYFWNWILFIFLKGWD